MSTSRSFLGWFVACAVLVACFSGSAAAQPRIAVWDPVKSTTEPRLKIDPAGAARIAGWLTDSGARAQLLTAEQIADASVFSAARFDGLVIEGSAFPAIGLSAIKTFAADGGVLMSFGADVPLLITIKAGEDGQWNLSPAEPKFAWQTTELLSLLGLRDVYEPERFDQGVWHPATPLLKKYLPEALDLRGKLPSRWVVPKSEPSEAGQIFPLLRSERRDIAAVPPQMYVVRRGPCMAIVSVNPMFTSDSQPKVWPIARQTVGALARLAMDLRGGTVDLKPESAARIGDLPPQASRPLDRVATGSVEPDHAPLVARWGRFDGSCDEFGPALAANQTATIAAGADSKAFPAALEPGASVRLALPASGPQPLFLRMRVACMETGAGLRAELDGRPVLNEIFVYVDASSPGNFSRGLIGLPSEITRIAYLGDRLAAGSVLTLSNPGTVAVHFDAVQIEHRVGPAPLRMTSINSGNGPGLTAELAKPFSGLRTSLRTNLLGPPGDPDRFKKMDALFEKAESRGRPIEAILEGTPPWAAISPERMAEAEQAKRPHTVPPDPVKYAQIVKDVMAHYGGRVASYEIWNEPDITQFYRGTAGEFLTLFQTIVPLLRAEEATKPIFLSGMSGYREHFLRQAHEAGVLGMSDRIAFHPYSGKAAGWDMPYGLLEGTLMSWGVDKEIYCNESGFPFKNAEWFTAPPVLSEETQLQNLSVAVSRIFASGLSKLCVFNAGGDDNPYGLVDGKGRARPAYELYADYARLAANEARRLDVSMTRADDAPIMGIYAAAALDRDGAATIIINPSQCDELAAMTDPTPALTAAANWTVFDGIANYAQGAVTVSPAEGKKYAGFYRRVTVDPARHPSLEIDAAAGADFQVLIKRADGSVVVTSPRQTAGKTVVVFGPSMGEAGAREIELSFRCHAPTTINAVRLLKSDHAVPAGIPIRLRVPLRAAAAAKATATAGGKEVPVEINLAPSDTAAVAEITFSLQARTIVRVQTSR